MKRPAAALDDTPAPPQPPALVAVAPEGVVYYTVKRKGKRGKTDVGGVPYTIKELNVGTIAVDASYTYELEEDRTVASLGLTLLSWPAVLVDKKDTLDAWKEENNQLGRRIDREEVIVPRNPTCCGFVLQVEKETFPIACPYHTSRSVDNTQLIVDKRQPKGKQVLLHSKCVACLNYHNNLKGNPINNPKVILLLD